MNRKDLPIVVALVALLLAWPHIDRWIVRTFYPERLNPPALETFEKPLDSPEKKLSPDETATTEQRPPALQAPAETVKTPATPAAVAAPSASADDPPATVPERRFTLRNDRAEYVFSSRGAALVEARLLEYRGAPRRDSPPVRFEFTEAPALVWQGVPGAGVEHDFAVAEEPQARRLRFERRTASGRTLVRTVELDDGFLLRIRDEWSPPLPEDAESPRLTLGEMRNLPGETLARGWVTLGVDTLSPGSEGVRFWGRDFAGFFTRDQKAAGAARPREEISRALPDSGAPLHWAAVKNKYFAQILRPERGADAIETRIRRAVTPEERSNPAYRPRVEIESVAAAVRFPARTAEAGAATERREMEFYFGPKKFSELQRLAHRQADIMEFRRLPAIAKLLLRTLVFLYGLIPNYGIAIILLTILIRLVFWPITRKGAQSMRRMQEIQPLVQEIRTRYKDNPQRQQKEIMALYKEHKVNPIGGCLPMLIQIPVFIALFDVLGGAIELRFAPFLWIRDLSEPENLFPGLLPFGLSLNLLPLIMTATQIWQQKLTPQAGDPSQQKMMTFMPIIMLVFFYNFASGLVLYWTTSQVLMIVSQLYQRHFVKPKPLAKPA